MPKTKLHYFIGAAVAATAGVVTLLVKQAMTKYPGIGDFLLLTLAGAAIGEKGRNWLDGRSFWYAAKASLAVAIFSLIYRFKRAGRFRLITALVLTVCVLIAMSLGEAVVG